MAPKPRGDGTYVIRTPTRADAKIPIIDMAHDYGLFVRLAIEGPEYAKGGEILTASEMISMHDLARQLSEGARVQCSRGARGRSFEYATQLRERRWCMRRSRPRTSRRGS